MNLPWRISKFTCRIYTWYLVLVSHNAKTHLTQCSDVIIVTVNSSDVNELILFLQYINYFLGFRLWNDILVYGEFDENFCVQCTVKLHSYHRTYISCIGRESEILVLLAGISIFCSSKILNFCRKNDKKQSFWPKSLFLHGRVQVDE